MSSIRARAADKLAAEIVGYVSGILPPGLCGREETWEAVRAADDRVMKAIRAWERGDIDYAALEEEGVRYVAAWEGVVREWEDAA